MCNIFSVTSERIRYHLCSSSSRNTRAYIGNAPRVLMSKGKASKTAAHPVPSTQCRSICCGGLVSLPFFKRLGFGLRFILRVVSLGKGLRRNGGSSFDPELDDDCANIMRGMDSRPIPVMRGAPLRGILRWNCVAFFSASSWLSSRFEYKSMEKSMLYGSCHL